MSKTSINGLKINNTVIKRISGPVNFCLLKTILGENLDNLKKSNKGSYSISSNVFPVKLSNILYSSLIKTESITVKFKSINEMS